MSDSEAPGCRDVVVVSRSHAVSTRSLQGTAGHDEGLQHAGDVRTGRAVMIELGYPSIRGYQPRSHNQSALIAVVEAQIRQHRWLDDAASLQGSLDRLCILDPHAYRASFS